MKKYILLFITLLIISCRTNSKENYLKEPDYRVIFTSKLDSNNQPLNNLEKSTNMIDEIYIYVVWYNIPKTKYKYTTKFYDSSGKQVYESELKFKSAYRGIYTCSGGEIDKINEESGLWKFQIYLDDVMVIEKELNINFRKES